MKKSKVLLLSLILVVGILVVACGGGAPPAPEPPAAEEPAVEEPAAEEEAAPASDDKVTIEWWHIWANEPDTIAEPFQAMADEFMAENPNVTINITMLENEAFKQKVSTVMQSGDHGLPLASSAAKNPLRKEIAKLAQSLHSLGSSDAEAA